MFLAGGGRHPLYVGAGRPARRDRRRRRRPSEPHGDRRHQRLRLPPADADDRPRLQGRLLQLERRRPHGDPQGQLHHGPDQSRQVGLDPLRRKGHLPLPLHDPPLHARQGDRRVASPGMDATTLWRAALLQLAAVAALSIALGLALPHDFFEDWGWLAGPASWMLCAAFTAKVLSLPLGSTLLGAVLAGIPSLLAGLLGLHWAGAILAVALFALWCARLPRPAAMRRA